MSKELKELETLQKEIQEDIKSIKKARREGNPKMMVLSLDTAVQSLNMEINLLVDALKKKRILE